MQLYQLFDVMGQMYMVVSLESHIRPKYDNVYIHEDGL